MVISSRQFLQSNILERRTEGMSLISKVLIFVGLLVTVAGNVATYFGFRKAVYGMQNSAAEGIGSVAWGMSSAYSFSFISLVGCFLLVVGLALSVIKRSPQPR
jgi:hypothetical protein